jgi:uncharacterized protein YjbI with pentapeptide repeats
MNNPSNICQYPNCNLPTHSTDGKYCLGHATPENKHTDVEGFNRFIRERLRDGLLNFDGFHFISAEFIAPNEFRSMPNSLSFRNCKFHGIKNNGGEVCSILFAGMHFRRKIDFTGSEFFNSIIFENNVFQSELLLNEIKVHGNVILKGGSCGKLEICNAVLDGTFSIDPSIGLTDTEFTYSQFNGGVIANNKEFQKGLNFNFSKFGGEVSLTNCNFKDTVTFSKCKIDKEIKFKESFFHDSCLINNSDILSYADFSNCKFIGESQFFETSFKQNAIFNNTQFESQVLWIKASFYNVYFKNSLFKRTCDFTEAAFNGEANFYSSKFESRVIFSGSHFLLRKYLSNQFLPVIYFENTDFNDLILFQNIQISGNIIFENINLSEKAILFFQNVKIHLACRVLFKNITFYPFRAFFEGIVTCKSNRALPSIVSFRNCNLRDIYFTSNEMSLFSFYKSSYDNSRFISSKWDSVRERLSFFKYKRRNTIFEDKILNQISSMSKNRQLKIKELYEISDLNSFEEVANLYRRFKVALDITKDYEQAGWFYFNEFEMKRMVSKGEIKSKYFLYSMYKNFAGYGEKPLWSFYWFIIFLLSFTFLNLFSGIKVNLETVINYDLSLNGFTTIFTSQFWSDAFNAFLFTLYRIIPIGYLPIPREQFLPLGADGYMIAFLNTGVLILFITFIAVGLKRIFRRF